MSDRLKELRRFRVFLLLLCLPLFLATCGGDNNGGSTGSYNPVWVYINTTNLSTTGTSSTVDLSGSAYCDACPPTEGAFGYCPAIQPMQNSAVSVSWMNKTTGESGSAYHGIAGSCSCLFSSCFTSYSHKWTASIPLAIGLNTIEIIATDPTGNSSTDSITITRTASPPSGVAAVPGKGQVTISWNSVPEATSYNLYWSLTGTVTAATGTKIPDVTSSYTHSGLSDSVTYYYLVTSVSGSYESPGSTVVWATPGWRTEVLSAATTTTTDRIDTSLAVDAGQNAHIHYSYNECLQYITMTEWNFQVCVTSAYHNSYITNASGTWASQSITSSSDVDAAIALDSGGNVHLSYTSFGLNHALYSAGSWSTQKVDSYGWCDSSLALDGADKVHMAYLGNSGSIRYASHDLVSWATTSVDTADLGCNGTGRLSLAVEGNGAAHVAYAGKSPDYGLIYATNRSGSWVVSTLGSDYITGVSISVDTNGNPHLAYTDNAGSLKYARPDGSGGWTIEVIESSGSPGYPSLVVDVTGKAHISYNSGLNNGQIRYATNLSGSWSIALVDAATFATDTALALDPQGKIHVSYFSKSRSLKYATNK